ncbi:MAG: cob(I)yrinic acid a,c-diamide adenosyltransferase [Deltaproteobacteria bacterium]|nr:cob(I)yrinic acid a,c-diamide adenosyltransferase [Deltaproteobacteria bacterium]
MKTEVHEKKKGLVLLFTGDGKGKSTAAFGQALRAAGQGLRVCIVQFIKGHARTGEARAFAALADKVEFHVKGSGFTWQQQDKEKLIRVARDAFAFAREKIMSDHFDMVVLDELTYLVSYGMVDEAQVIELIRSRPAGLHLVITGRDAGNKLVEEADLVSEVKMIKHPYSAGVKARKGIEF